MSRINSKAELYQTAAILREKLGLTDPCDAETVLQRIQAQPNVRVAYLPFQSPALRGMCSPGKPGQEDIILLSSRLSDRERGFYAAHEWIHLCCHRNEQKAPFRCNDYTTPRQDSYQEWQANEGAAEILMPWQLVLQYILDNPPDLSSRTSLVRLRLQLADRFGVSDQMAAVRLESLRYEIACALSGQPLDSIELLSFHEQQRRGIQVRSLEETARELFLREQRYHRSLRSIDI